MPGATVKLAFLNPYQGMAENQAARTMMRTAPDLGIELQEFHTSHDVEAFAPDIVVNLSQLHPKLTDHPTFGVLHAPLADYLAHIGTFRNSFMWDGALTIMETLETYHRETMEEAGMPAIMGPFFGTSYLPEFQADIEGVLKAGQFRVAYFGTNWDGRKRAHFTLLDRLGVLAIHGPPEGWAYLTGDSYKGALPFDGESVQRAYAQYGAGLVLLGDAHLDDDLISNRVFEITAAGAVAICCDVPWLRRHFGDSLYYVDQDAPPALFAKQILEVLNRIHANPAEAAQKAAEARRIFAERFTARLMLQGILDTHDSWQAWRRGAATPFDAHAIDVLVLAEGASREAVATTLGSLARQSAGRFHVHLIGSDEGFMPEGRVAEIIAAPSAAAALRSAKGEHVMALRAGVRLFADHVLHLLRTGGAVAFSASLEEHDAAIEPYGRMKDTRRVTGFDMPWGAEGAAALDGIDPDAFLIRRDLATLGEGEDAALLPYRAAAQATPLFSHKATFLKPQAFPALGMATRPSNEAALAHLPGRRNFVGHFLDRRAAVFAAKNARLGAHDLGEVIVVSAAAQPSSRLSDAQGGGLARLANTAAVQAAGEGVKAVLTQAGVTLKGAREEGAWIWRYEFRPQISVEYNYLLIVKLLVREGEAELVLPTQDRGSTMMRVALPAAAKPYEVQLRITATRHVHMLELRAGSKNPFNIEVEGVFISI